MRKRNCKPAHPGPVFKDAVLEPLGLSISDAADHLGISRKHLSKFINEHVPCSKDMAQRISAATNTSVGSWLRMQTALDIWEAEHSHDNYAYGTLLSHA